MSTALFRKLIAFCSALMLVAPLPGQVRPDHILNPRLKADEAEFLPQLELLQESIQAQHFMYPFQFAGYIHSRHGRSFDAEGDGIECMYFNDMEIIKVSGVYKAAYSASSLSENERAAKTLEDVVVPILQLAAKEFSQRAPGNGIGVEVVYNTRDRENAYDYEGHEVITAIFDWRDVFAYVQTDDAEVRQEILNRSGIYVNGKAFGVALHRRDPLPLEALERSVPRALRDSKDAVSSQTFTAASLHQPYRMPSLPVASTVTESPTRAASESVESEELRFKKQLDAMAIRDKVKLHLDADAPPKFEQYGDQVALHVTLRNPLSYAQSTTSIYKRSAQGLDLVIAPELKALLDEIPSGASFSLLHFTLARESGAGLADAENIEYICPVDSVRLLVANKITSQDLVDHSRIMVNSVPIRIDLQLVE